MKKLEHYIVPPLLIGAAGAAITYGVEGQNTQIDLFGQNYSAPFAIGIASGVGALGTELVGDALKTVLPSNLANSKAFEPLVTGSFTAGVYKMASNASQFSNLTPMKSFGVGAVADLGGRWVNDQWLRM